MGTGKLLGKQGPKLRLTGRQCDQKLGVGDQNFRTGRQQATNLLSPWHLKFQGKRAFFERKLKLPWIIVVKQSDDFTIAIFTQPRSQGLSSLPPLVVGIKTLVAAGHVTTQNLGGKKICWAGGVAEYFDCCCGKLCWFQNFEQSLKTTRVIGV